MSPKAAIGDLGSAEETAEVAKVSLSAFDGIDERMTSQGQAYDFGTFEQFYVQQTRLPVGRIGAPTDVANMVAYLASPLADFITGANVRVDGGMMPTTN